jgi:hypothetical protein
MDTKASFIGQTTNSISRQIVPKKFHNLSHAIPDYGCWHNLSGFVQVNYPPRQRIISTKMISSLLFRENLLCIDHHFLSRQGICVSIYNLRPARNTGHPASERGRQKAWKVVVWRSCSRDPVVAEGEMPTSSAQQDGGQVDVGYKSLKMLHA